MKNLSLALAAAAVLFAASGARADQPAALAVSAAAAPAPAPKSWKNSAELTYVETTGNTQLSTFGANDTFDDQWGPYALEAKGSALDSRTDGTTTAEQYGASEKVLRKVDGNGFYTYEDGGWAKDRFAGILDRYTADGGMGNQLLKTAFDQLDAEVGAGAVRELRIGSPDKNFANGRLYAKYTRKLSATATFSQDGEYIYDLDDERDYRFNSETALTASLTTHLSLKASYKWHFQDEPVTGFVKSDTLTSIALVVNY